MILQSGGRECRAELSRGGYGPSAPLLRFEIRELLCLRALGEVERIQLASRDRARLSACAQIVRLNVRAGSRELDGPPLPPSALMAAIGLLITESLPERFDETTETGRKNARRIA